MQSTRGKLSDNAQPTSVGRPEQSVEKCAKTELQDRIETWVNEGGAGDDVER